MLMLKLSPLCLSPIAGQSMEDSFDYAMRQRRDFEFLRQSRGVEHNSAIITESNVLVGP